MAALTAIAVDGTDLSRRLLTTVASCCASSLAAEAVPALSTAASLVFGSQAAAAVLCARTSNAPKDADSDQDGEYGNEDTDRDLPIGTNRSERGDANEIRKRTIA